MEPHTNAGPAAQTQLHALEPRMLFDAAALFSVAETQPWEAAPPVTRPTGTETGSDKPLWQRLEQALWASPNQQSLPEVLDNPLAHIDGAITQQLAEAREAQPFRAEEASAGNGADEEVEVLAEAGTGTVIEAVPMVDEVAAPAAQREDAQQQRAPSCLDLNRWLPELGVSEIFSAGPDADNASSQGFSRQLAASDGFEQSRLGLEVTLAQAEL